MILSKHMINESTYVMWKIVFIIFLSFLSIKLHFDRKLTFELIFSNILEYLF